MNRVLLVDDDPIILRTIKHMMKTYTKNWEIFTAKNGIEALDVLKQNKIDLVFSDISMPNMNGIELLEIVKEKYPFIVRIMHSSESNRETFLKTVKIAHQFLAKPVDFKRLQDTLQKALNHHKVLKNKGLRRILAEIDILPSLPELFIEIKNALNDEDVSIQHITSIIKKDVSMTAELIRLVNSSFFGVFNKITNLDQATALLGVNTIKNLVLTIKVFNQFADNSNIPFSIKELWNHSFYTALFTSEIVYDFTKDRELKENAYTIGLLHDIGIITLACKATEKYNEAYNYAFNNKTAIYEGENAVFKSSHEDVGAYLTGLWGFPEKISTAIQNHHKISSRDANFDFMTLALHCADVFEQQIRGKNLGLDIETINPRVLEDFRFIHHKERWYGLCKKAIDIKK